MAFQGFDTVVTGSMATGTTRYWAVAVAAGHVVVDTAQTHLPLRHSHHRYAIDGPNGVQQLTIPLVAESHTIGTAMRDVRISEHGNWRRLHWGALYSAYGRTPYFDYVAPDLEPIIHGGQHFLLDFNQAMQALIADFMMLPVKFTHEDYTPRDGVLDLRRTLDAKRADDLPIDDLPYYQAWQARHPFLPALSVLDLLMNEGPTAIVTLTKMCRQDANNSTEGKKK